MSFWPQEAIESALGADIADAIPELLRLGNLEVRIARLEIVALKRLAERDGRGAPPRDAKPRQDRRSRIPFSTWARPQSAPSP